MIRNLAEEHVLAAYEALRVHFPDFCGCEVCRDDAMVYALNRGVPFVLTNKDAQVSQDVLTLARAVAGEAPVTRIVAPQPEPRKSLFGRR